MRRRREVGLKSRIATDGLMAHCSVADTPFFDELADFNAEEIYARDDALDAVSQALELIPRPSKKAEPKPWPKSALRMGPRPEPGRGLRFPLFAPPLSPLRPLHRRRKFATMFGARLVCGKLRKIV